MEQATTDAIETIANKETWTAEDYQELLEQFYDVSEAGDKARKLVRQIENANPDAKGTVAVKVGIAQFMVNRFRDALETLSDATDNKDRRFFQAQCYKNLGQYEKAAEDFERAKSKGWDPVEADVEIVECHALAGNLDDAQKGLDDVADAAGDSANYCYVKGLIKELQGAREEAGASYAQALKKNDDHSGAAFRLAYLKDLYGEEEEALNLYRKCTAKPPVRANALMNMAVVYEDMGKYDHAINCLHRVLSVNPNHQRARLYLKDCEASKVMYFDEDQARRIAKRNAVLDIPVTDFELSVRARNCLKKMNIRTLGDLVKTTEAELLGYKNFGETSLKEIKDMLSAKGLRLGMAMEEGSEFYEPDQSGATSGQNEGVMATPLDHIEFSVRARRALDNLKIRTLGELAQKSEPELLACKNFGQTSLNEIKQRLAEYNLSLRETS
ncbi:MAG: DNA-directed RNA polymerase subunit alpha C-terminal domain-containing protein [Phycisphaerae bacterium]